MSNTLDIQQHGQVLRIALNRAAVFNSFNREMALALQDCLRAAGTNPDVRCIIIIGNGKAFCAGQDLAEVSDPNGPDLKTILGEHYNPIVQLIRETPKPIIAAVNGVAAGAGANIALACDIVVASQSASFIQAFSKIGLIPDSGGTFTLPRIIGFQKASALMMLGDKINADDAERMGMVYKVVKDEEFNNYIDQLAQQVAGMPTHGLALTKAALNLSFSQTWQEQLHTEEKLQIEAGHTHDYNEGVKAFIEKRKPSFLGK